jgi:D-amino-acid dehydrogenase
MKIIILGSGLLGVTAAYELGKRGHEVTVLDRQATSGAETSYANGGQISYGSAEPWANPAVLPKLPKWLFHPDAPLVFRWRADREMIRWGLQFLRNCSTSRAYVNCANLLRLNIYSKDRMADIVAETGVEFNYTQNGILHIYTSEKDFAQAKRHSDVQAKFGYDQNIVSREQCFSLEPSLQDTSRQIVGGVHAFQDACGDAYTFCNALAKVATERYGVTFNYGVEIQELIRENNRIVAVKTSAGELSAEEYVMAMGSHSPRYLRPLGIDLPIYPMKGYSVTLKANEHCPHSSITDGSHKIVYSRLGDRMRIAGTAEFAGYNEKINGRRIKSILKAARELFPQANWDQEIEKWACLRPSTPDGLPVIGVTLVQNLFLNTGHGTLGWTQAAGSATLLADVMEGKIPAIMMHGLTMEKYL